TTIPMTAATVAMMMNATGAQKPTVTWARYAAAAIRNANRSQAADLLMPSLYQPGHLQVRPRGRPGGPPRLLSLSKCFEHVVAGAHLVERCVDLRTVEQLGHAAAALTRDERYDGAAAAGTAGTTGPVQVRLVLVGRVCLDHEVDVV